MNNSEDPINLIPEALDAAAPSTRATVHALEIGAEALVSDRSGALFLVRREADSGLLVRELKDEVSR